MKIIFFVNALKGSLTTSEICKLKDKFPITFVPLSDGGDGFLETIKYALPAAKENFISAKNALGKIKKTSYLTYKNSAFLECAKIAGLAEIKPEKRDVLHATSYGIGTVLKVISKTKVKKVFVGLGGVAFNDGGAGCLQALGYKLLDGKGKEILPGISGLIKLRKIIVPKNLKLPKIICFSDVKNKLFGRLGSAQVYGPQKGAGKTQIVLIEKALKNFQKVTRKNLDKQFYGASGALPIALCGVLKARITKGSEEILKLLKAENLIKKADLILTSEGCLDEQSLFGKAPFEILKLAKKHKKQVLFICGKNKLNSSVLKKYTNLQVAELCALAKNEKDSFVNVKVYLKKVLGDLYEKV